MIGWLTNVAHMDSPYLKGWFDRTRVLWDRLNCPPIFHIYRENNTRVDRLSKRGLQEEFGFLKVAHFQNGRLRDSRDIPLP